MKILIIPDVHLKPWMFDRADNIYQMLKKTQTDVGCVCLGDIPDDWNQQYNLELYEQTFDATIKFAEKHPETLWCYGNHDLSYVYGARQSGYSDTAKYLVREKLRQLESAVPEGNFKLAHLIDNTIFSHGGLSENWVRYMVPSRKYPHTEEVVEIINQAKYPDTWSDTSVLWYRPQFTLFKPYRRTKVTQVVGHTPVVSTTMMNNIISCDTFSTRRDGSPFGDQKFTIVDTTTHEFETLLMVF